MAWKGSCYSTFLISGRIGARGTQPQPDGSEGELEQRIPHQRTVGARVDGTQRQPDGRGATRTKGHGTFDLNFISCVCAVLLSRARLVKVKLQYQRNNSSMVPCIVSAVYSD
jgi:hypothetical protein